MIYLKKMYRITLFVPPSHLEGILENIMAINPLKYGKYDSVMWWSNEGTEQFRPLDGAVPAKGETNTVSRLPSVMVQFSLPHDDEVLNRVIMEGIIPFHPWEEPVIQIHEILATRVSAVAD